MEIDTQHETGPHTPVSSASNVSLPHLARLGVLADDLTGAADTALSFWMTGLDSLVALHAHASLPQLPSPAEQTQVVALDVDTRHRTAAEASARTLEAIRQLRQAGTTYFYKKIDSTLRGNVGAEIEVALRASEATQAFICPAFPSTGRTVERGRVQVAGADLLDSALAHDPRNPLVSSRIADVLHMQCTLPVVELAAPEEVSLSQGTPLVVFDAVTDADLHRWVERVGLRSDVLWVGSAGLARALASMLAHSTGPVPASGPSAAQLPVRPPQSRPVLVAVGSIHTVCREQLEALQALPRVFSLALEPARILADLPHSTTAEEEIPGLLVQALQRGEHVLMYSLSTEAAKAALDAELLRTGHDLEWAGERIAAELGWRTQVLSEQLEDIPDLVLTGGDTARAVLGALGISILRVMGAVESGVPVGQSLDGRVRVVTKAGGFGERDTLVRAVAALRAT